MTTSLVMTVLVGTDEMIKVMVMLALWMTIKMMMMPM
jgi:hypothetical protein